MSDTHGNAPFTSGQYNEVLIRVIRGLPKALKGRNYELLLKALDDGDGLVTKLTELFRRIQGESPKIFRVDVDQSARLETILLPTDITFDPRIYHDRFVRGYFPNWPGIHPVDIFLFPFSDRPSPREAVDRLLNMGYRAASVVEVYTLGAKFFDEVKKLEGIIIPLGSKGQIPGFQEEFYPVLKVYPDEHIQADLYREEAVEQAKEVLKEVTIYYAATRK